MEGRGGSAGGVGEGEHGTRFLERAREGGKGMEKRSVRGGEGKTGRRPGAPSSLHPFHFFGRYYGVGGEGGRKKCKRGRREDEALRRLVLPSPLAFLRV